MDKIAKQITEQVNKKEGKKIEPRGKNATNEQKKAEQAFSDYQVEYVNESIEILKMYMSEEKRLLSEGASNPSKINQVTTIQNLKNNHLKVLLSITQFGAKIEIIENK